MGTHIFYSANPAQATTPTTIMHPADMIAPATLYVVATPIGNLADSSPRSIEVLRAADIVACEDTRTSRTLLAHHGITTPTVSFHQHNTRSRLPHLLARLSAGQRVALVTDRVIGLFAVAMPTVWLAT